MLKVVFCSDFPVEILKPGIRLKDDSLRLHPCSWIRAVSDKLVESGEIDLHIITANNNLLGDQVIRKDGITYHLLESALPKWIIRGLVLSDSSTLWIKPLWKIRRQIRLINPDIVHGHGTEGCFSLIAVYSGYPNVISIQGIIAKVYQEDPCLRYRLVRYVEAHTIRKARHINLKTMMSESFVTSFSPHSDKYFIEASINEIFWSQQQADFARNIFFVGPLIKRKGIEEFILSYIMLKSEFTDLRGYVIGDSTDEGKQRLTGWVREAGVADDLIFTGQLSHEKIIGLYRAGGVFCLTSYIENSPNVVMEAMAAGLPVVATNVGDVKHIVDDGASGFIVEKKDVSGTVQAIGKLLDDKDRYFSFGKRGREIATARWKPDIIAKKHVEMYREIIGKANGTNK